MLRVKRDSFYDLSRSRAFLTGSILIGLLFLGCQLDGHQDDDYNSAPVPVKLEASYHYALVLLDNGDCYAWGNGFPDFWPISANTVTFPPVLVMEHLRDISLSSGFGYFVTDKGALYSWGDNSLGQLGDGTTIDRSTPVLVFEKGVTGVETGNAHAVILMENGDVYTVGNNMYGQLGDGSFLTRLEPVYVMSDIEKINAAGNSSFAITVSGDLMCFGDNGNSQLGITGGQSFSTPRVSASGIISVDSGGSHTLALSSDGTLLVTGRNDYGQLGTDSLGALAEEWSPVTDFSGLVSRLACGDHHSILLLEDGSAQTFGLNTNGQLGTGIKRINREGRFSVGKDSVFVAAEPNTSFIYNRNGELGMAGTLLGMATGAREVGTPRFLLSGIRDISVNPMLSSLFLIDTDMNLYAYGENTIYGQLGLPEFAGYKVIDAPQKVADDIVSVAATEKMSFFVDEQGRFFFTGGLFSLFGGNNYPGDGTLDGKEVFTENGLVADAALVSSYSAHTLILKTDGTLWGFGANNYGQLGDGTKTDRLEPVLIAEDVFSAWAGPDCSYYILSDGSLWGCGLNSFGKLGQGGAYNSYPDPVLISDNAVFVSGSSGRTVFIQSDGSLWACGYNNSGQLDGVAENEMVMKPVLVADDVISAACRNDTVLAVKNDGRLLVWGRENENGVLGTEELEDTDVTGVTIMENVRKVYGRADDGLFILTTTDDLYVTGDNDPARYGLLPFKSIPLPITEEY